MSVAATHWALEQRGLSDGAFRLLFVLADYADEYGECWPSHARLAERIERGVDTVKRRADELQALGLISVEGRTRIAGDKIITLSNRYRLHLDRVRPSRKTAPQADSPPVQICGGGSETQQGPEPQQGGGESAPPLQICPPVQNCGAGGAPDAPPRGAYGAPHMESTIEPPRTLAAAAAGADARTDREIVDAWDARLLAVAGPGLVDPARDASGAFHYHRSVLASWARAGVDLELDAVPVIRAKTAKRRQRPIGAWSVLTDDVIAARDRRLAQLPAFNPETAHVQPADAAPGRAYRSAGERDLAATDARRASWARVLGENAEFEPGAAEGSGPMASGYESARGGEPGAAAVRRHAAGEAW